MDQPRLDIAPALALYPPDLARNWTRWLYENIDPSFPMYGTVRVARNLAVFGTGTQAVVSWSAPNRGIVVSLRASARNVATPLNIELIDVSLQNSNGLNLIETQPLTCVAGTGEWPARLISPWLVEAQRPMVFTFTNNTGVNVTDLYLGIELLTVFE